MTLFALGEIIESVDSGFASGDDLAEGLAQLRMNNVTTQGTFDWTRLRRVNSDGNTKSRYLLSPGDLLFNATNSPDLVGKSALFRGFSEPITFSNHFYRVRLRQRDAVPGFVLGWMLHCWRQRTFEHLCTCWVNQATVRKDDLLELQIDLPSLEEQTRFVTLLDRADRLRRMRRHAVQMCDEVLPAVFEGMFGDPGVNHSGFDRVFVEELFSTARSGTKCGPFGSALKNNEYTPAGIPVWTMANVGQNEFQEDGCLFISDAKYEDLKAYDVQNGDILISRAGTVGRMAIANTRFPKSIIHTNLIRLSLNSARVLPIYFVVLMTHFGTRVARLKRGQEDAYSFMSTGTLGELRIPLPPMELQQRFAEAVSRLYRLRAMHREASRQADHLFETLLQRAFGVGVNA